MLTWLQRDTLTFPPLAKAMREPNGLLGPPVATCRPSD